MQKTLLALLFTLLFTGCMERGQSLTPAPVHAMPISTKPTQAISKVKPIEVEKTKTTPIPVKSSKMKEKTTNQQTAVKIATDTKTPKVTNITEKDEPIFPLSDDTKNKISGFFIFVIGIIILL